MRKQVYHSKYVSYEFDEKNSILIETWTSEHLSNAIFKEEQMHKKELLETYRPTHILDDISQTDFSIDPELQEWTEQLFVPVFAEIGVTKYAIVLPTSLFGQVSMEQTVDEVKEQHDGIEFKYFDSEPEAENWLKELDV
jgi:hypothetical protein